MKWISWHAIWIVALGYALGYWFPSIGNMTIGKIKARG
jgi:hypothetical protein